MGRSGEIVKRKFGRINPRDQHGHVRSAREAGEVNRPSASQALCPVWMLRRATSKSR